MRSVVWTCWWVFVGCLAISAEAVAQSCGPNGCSPNPRANAGAHPAVCRVIHNLPGGLRCLGSGVLVDKEGQYGLVITCQHLFRDGPGTTQAIFPDGQAFEAKLLHQDPAADLAALLIARPSAEPVPVADTPPQPGEPVQSCGYGPDGRYWCNQGRVVGYARTASAPGWETLELTGRARQGDSGGPVFNAQGQLVAVLWGTDGRSVSAAYCGRVDRFLQQTGRYLLPWNARNDPANRPPTNPPGSSNAPGSGGAAGSAGDLNRIEARLDRILDLLNQGRSGPSAPVPPAEQQGFGSGASGIGVPSGGESKGTAPSAGASAESTRSEASVLQQAVQHLVGELGNLPERIQARIEKVQSAGAQTTPETIRAYAQDFLAEKLADGSLGWTMGKLLAAALGLSGPVALGLTLGAWLVSRRIGRKVQAGEPLLVQQLAERLGALLGRSTSSGTPIGQGPLPTSATPTS
ncbi:MAG TPA: serine protease [Thermoguttaceae bacterium]|nr:serine protease [Thermoguttaceae bacterium]